VPSTHCGMGVNAAVYELIHVALEPRRSGISAARRPPRGARAPVAA
jgi:hypothetical protein